MSLHCSPSPAITLAIELTELEAKILEHGNDMRTEDARSLHNTLVSYYEDFVNFDLKNWGCFDFDKWCIHSNFVIKQVFRLEKKLLQFFSPVYTLSPIVSDSKVNDQLDTTADLSPLLQKQLFFIEMIESLEPTGDLNLQEAKVQSKYLDKLYEKFISNQSEIATLVKEAPFGDQVEISQTVQQKVLQIQTKLEEIISPIKTIPQTLTRSVINEHFDQIERPHVIVDFLDSQIKKQKSLIKQIELIESKNDLIAVEAETLHSHLSQLHDRFVKNQSKIEPYISGLALDEQLQIADDILQKVIAVQIKLKRIFAPVQVAVTSILPAAVSSGELDTQVKSLESVSSVPEALSSVDEEAQAKLSLVGSVTTVPKSFSFSDDEAQTESSKSVTSVPKDISSDVEAQGELLGLLSYLNDKLDTLICNENHVYKKILQNIDYPPEVAGSIHLRPWVDDSYQRFLSCRKYKERDFREFPYLLKKVRKSSERVERAIEDYGLYCEGRIPKENLIYISSMIEACAKK